MDRQIDICNRDWIRTQILNFLDVVLDHHEYQSIEAPSCYDFKRQTGKN